MAPLSRVAPRRLAFEAFLSHRYKSPDVNLYFFDIIPMMRIRRAGAARDTGDPVAVAERTLFGGVDVGYGSEVLYWPDLETLRHGLQARIANVLERGTRINDADAADAYFRSAAQRKERVFLSYAGDDEKRARLFARALNDRFQEVFDYRDGTSIRHGEAWREEVFANLSVTAVGIMLLSPAYLQSAHCKEEALVMKEHHTQGRLRLFPIVLADAFASGGKRFRYFPAEMNHSVTREWCQRAGAQIDDLRGAAHSVWEELRTR